MRNVKAPSGVSLGVHEHKVQRVICWIELIDALDSSFSQVYIYLSRMLNLFTFFFSPIRDESSKFRNGGCIIPSVIWYTPSVDDQADIRYGGVVQSSSLLELEGVGVA